MTVSERIEQLALDVVKSLGAKLFRFEDLRQSGKLAIKVFVHKEKGVSIQDCANISRSIETMIEAEGLLVNEPYTLEVSSLGIDHPLIEKREFEINIGRSVTVHYQDKCNKEQKKTAILRQITDDTLHFDNREETFTLCFNQVIKGIVEVSF